MPVLGRKPKPEEQRRNRVKPVYDWIEVPHVPYEGEKPSPGRVPTATKRWWDAISRMPQCALWDETDWRFALDTAAIHATFYRTKSMAAAVELRNREKVLGTTMDFRRDLRIRYVEVEPIAEEPEGVVSLDDYRASI